jgi:hypothetical protein
MPNASTTQASSASATTGQPQPLGYGYVWATGKRHAYYTVQDSGYNGLDYTRVGFWLLGEGEWDGCAELWISDKLAWRGNNGTTSTWLGWDWQTPLDYTAQGIVFHFHPGTDATSGQYSTGGDQGLDALWSLFPPAINQVPFSRIAYYGLMRKQPIIGQTSTTQSDSSQWTDINPIGLWRALKCRLFDANGKMTGYAWTRNPVWHWIDVRLRRKLMPWYNISTSSIDDISTAVRACFDWDAIYSSAQYCDEQLSNGKPRFRGDYMFTSACSLQAIEEQIARVCRGYYTSYGGQDALCIDRPRSVAFTFKREHLLPGTFEANDQAVHTAGNRYVGQFRDLEVAASNTIASITCSSNGRPQVTTTDSHPFNDGDYVSIGATDTTYDSVWQVYSVPDVENSGTPEEVDPTTLVLVRKGSNYPSSVGSGGKIGLLSSRFKERAPQFWHKANMWARGSVAIGVPRYRQKASVTIDLGTSTYDQASRICCYERDRALGPDTAGADGTISSNYVTPPQISFSTSMFAKDDAGNLVMEIVCGDHVAIDDTLSVPYAGDYEVEVKKVSVPTVETSGQNGSIALSPAQNSGEVHLTLRPYRTDIFYDSSDSTGCGWDIVPGSEPGGDESYTQIDLDDGGIFVFFASQADAGTQFDLPSSGFPSANMLAWASAAGTNVNYHSARRIQLCSASSARLLTLTYNDDEGHTWSGTVNYAGLAWLDTETTTTTGNMTYVELTLKGGEQIAFGQGILADGDTIPVPSGYTLDPDFAVAFIHDQSSTGYSWVMHLVGAYVDSNSIVHVNTEDGEGHIWHGNASVLVFLYKNNDSGFTKETVSNTVWAHCTLSNGKKFGVGVAKNLANGSAFSLPTVAGDGTTLQTITGSSYGYNVSGSVHAQGVGACYLDNDLNAVIYFQNGSSTKWYGKLDAFGVYYESGDSTPVLVDISPSSVSLSAGSTQQFAATVSGSSKTDVIWAVDGVTGGNVTVGTIDGNGLYAAPNAAGTHTITATSEADSTVSGSATVTVYGAVLTG